MYGTDTLRRWYRVVAVALAVMVVMSGGLGGVAVVKTEISGVGTAEGADTPWGYTGTSHDLNSEEQTLTGTYQDSEGNWWIVGIDNDTVYKYDSEWSYTGTSHDVSTESTLPQSIHKGDDGNWYLLDDSSDAVYKYDSGWSYTGTSYNIKSEESSPGAIYQGSGGYWYLVGSDNSTVYKYDSGWSYTGTSYDISSEETASGGLYEDSQGNWWLVGSNSDSVHKYDSDWSYTGTSYDVSSESSAPTGMFKSDEDYWYLLGSSTGMAYKYTGVSYSSGSSSTYSQIYELDDRTGLFPPDRSLITLYEWDPGAKSLSAPSESEEWSHVTSKGFNADAKATVDMVDGDYYKLSIQGPTGDTWELIGFGANSSTTEQTLTITDFGTEGTPTPTAEPTPTPTAYPNGSTPVPEATPTPTPEQGFGPDMVGYCSVPDTDERGLEIEYRDPDYTTTELNYHLTDNGTVYSGRKTFPESDPVGYWRGCVAPAALGNDTDPREVDGTYNGTYDDGSAFNGTLSFGSSGGSVVGGPVGSGGGSTSTAATVGGYGLLGLGALLAYRRFGDGQLEAALGAVGRQVSRLFER
jgi:hypothetical protein